MSLSNDINYPIIYLCIESYLSSHNLSNKVRQMFIHTLLQSLYQLAVHSHSLLILQNLLFFKTIASLTRNSHHSTELQPPIRSLRVSKLSQNNIDVIAIIREKNIMRNTELYQFISYNTKDKGKRRSYLGTV